jgi:cytochrome c biogenesis DsbD-like protein
MAILCSIVPFSLFAQQQHRLAVLPATQLVGRPGTTVTQQTRISVEPGFHVNSDKPTDEYVIPLKLTWTDGQMHPESVTYPKPESIKVGTETLSVLTGDFVIQTRFSIPRQAQPGSSTLVGKLRYQACNNQMCLRPATAEVRVPVLIQ